MSRSDKHIILAVAFSQFVTPFMFSGVGVTLPAIGHEFSASALQLGLIESVYIGTSAAVLLPMGKIADLTDKKFIFKIGLILYALFSFLLGATFSIESMLFLRFLQGIAAGMLLPTSMAILTELVPREQLGKAIGLAIGSVYLGLSSGPFVAGILSTYVSWRAVYFFGASLIVVATVTSYVFLPTSKRLSKFKIDLAGSLTVMLAIGLLIAGSANLHKNKMGIFLMLAGVVAAAVFIVIERKVKDPLINIVMISNNKIFSRAVVVQFLNYSGTFGMTLLFSLYLQSIKGMSAQRAGIVLMISPVLMATLAPVFGRLSDRFPPSLLAFGGMFLCAISVGLGLAITVDSSMLSVYILFAFMGLGFSMFSSPNMNIIMSSVEKKDLSIAAAIAAKMRTMGMVVSLIIINTCLSFFMGKEMITNQSRDKYMTVMHTSLLFFSLLMITGIWFSIQSLRRHGRR